MTKTLAVLAFATVIAWTGSVAAQETGYAFKFDNATGASASVLVDGKSVCELSAGGHCTVTVSADEHAYAIALAGAAPKDFSPGNPEMADLCKIDASGVHCLDPMGKPTN